MAVSYSGFSTGMGVVLFGPTVYFAVLFYFFIALVTGI
jgi:hypothetical protein